MPTPDVPLDPADFVIVPDVFVLDEFDMTDDDGQVVARIDSEFIRKTVARMQEREQDTGDLCPYVIGHTKDNPQGEDEVDGPPLVGYARNWKQLPFFDTGKTAAAPDIWIYKADVPRARRFTRRSSEVWLTRHEIDPISALGATSPARDLGLLKLDANARLTVLCAVEGDLFSPPKQIIRLARDCRGNCTLQPTNREAEMAEGNMKPPADSKESGSYKEVMGKIDQLTSTVMALTDKISSMMGGGTAAAGGAGAANGGAAAGAAGGGEDQPLTDDELQKMMSEAYPESGGEEGGAEGAEGGDGEEEDAEKKKSRKGEEVVKNTGYAGGNDTFVPNADIVKKMARQDEELTALRLKLARNEVKDKLQKSYDTGADVEVDDEKLITNLVALPEDLRDDMIVRLSRKQRISGDRKRGHADAANASTVPAGVKRVTEEVRPQIIKLARQKGIQYDAAAAEMGYTVGQ